MRAFIVNPRAFCITSSNRGKCRRTALPLANEGNNKDMTDAVAAPQ
jgi:hypothetical protein